MENTDMNRLLKLQDIAQTCHVSLSTVKRWIAKQGLPCYRFTNNMTRVRASALEKFLQEHIK